MLKLTNRRSVSLDIVRIGAALWVLSFHWFTCSGCFYGFKETPSVLFVPSFFTSIAQWGFLGVDIFFILSGCLIAKSAIANQWWKFAGDRFIRLFPAYFFCGVLSLFLYPLATNNSVTVAKIFSLSGLQFWIGGPAILFSGWTLPVEISFYFLITCGIYLYSKKNGFGPKELRAFLSIWLFLYILANTIALQPLQNLLTPMYAPFFILGASLSLVTSKRDLLQNSITISISLILTLKNVLYRIEEHPTLNHKFLSSLLLVLFMCAVILYSQRPVKYEISSSRMYLIQTLSRMTYPIYLLHLEVGLTFVYLFLKLGLGSPGAFGAGFLVITAISAFIVLIFEPISKKLLRKHVLTGATIAKIDAEN